MGKKRKQLSQAEVWDDSALIQSWDDALEEYKLYHSIHARGERVEDVLREAGLWDKEMTESNGRGPYEATTDVHSNYAAPDELEEGELEDGEDGDVEAAPREKLPEHNGSVLEKAESFPQPEQPNPPDTSTAAQPQGLSSAPSSIFAGVQDNAMKNLMMSWYYAGYYTGLYDGQKQAKTT